MKVVYDDRLYIVHWQHERSGIVTQYGERTFDNRGGVTVCTIQEGTRPNHKVIADKIAECSNKDTYCKATGRKVSLTRALACCANKEFRKVVWSAYRKECRS